MATIRLKKYTNKLKKETKKEVNSEVPVWFDEKIGKENLSEKEELELESILKKYED